MSAYDERLAIVDNGDALVLSVPIPPSTETGGTPVDLGPILDRLGNLELEVATLKQANLAQDEQIADILTRLTALETATP